jgi:hypothetical protein
MKTVKAFAYRAGDVLSFQPQIHQLFDVDEDDWVKWQTLTPPGVAWTCFAYRATGQTPIASGGLRPIRGQNVKEFWALIGAPRRAEWGALIKMARAAIDADPAGRVQAVGYTDHPHAAQTLEHLGLSFEGVMHGYGPNGRDAALYARVR